MAGAGPREPDHRRFPALGIRNYRLFWIGGMLTNNGRWNQYVASYFVVYQLSLIHI